MKTKKIKTKKLEIISKHHIEQLKIEEFLPKTYSIDDQNINDIIKQINEEEKVKKLLI